MSEKTQTTPDEAFDTSAKIERTHAFIQWKGTDVCMDFYCECGERCHVDDFFAYTVECPECKVIWEMPIYLFPRKANEKTYEYWRENPRRPEKEDD